MWQIITYLEALSDFVIIFKFKWKFQGKTSRFRNVKECKEPINCKIQRLTLKSK